METGLKTQVGSISAFFYVLILFLEQFLTVLENGLLPQPIQEYISNSNRHHEFV